MTNFDIEFEESAVVSALEDFLQRSSDAYSSDVNRVREDLEFFGGSQWSTSLIKDLKRNKRVNRQFSELGKYCNAIISPASKSPYHPRIGNGLAEVGAKRIEEVQGLVDAVVNESAFKGELKRGLRNSVPTGDGVINLTTIAGKDGSLKVVIESVRDVSTVAFDPNCTRLDMCDATEGAIVNYIPKKRIRYEYPDIRDNDWDAVAKKALPTQWSVPKDCVPLVSYYRLSADGTHVEFFKVCGDVVVEAKVLATTHIPLYKLTGEEVYRENRFVSVGIVEKVRDLQVGENLAYSTLIERMNRSVKAGYICTAEAIDGMEANISKLSEGDVPLFLYKKGEDKPTQIVEAFQTQDVISVLNTSRDMIQGVIGVPSVGVQGINNVNTTATEALLQQVNSESNVACFYEGLENVCRAVSETVLDIVTDGNPEGLTVTLENGPATITQKMKKRQELAQLSAIVPDNVKPLVAKYYADTLEDSVGEQLGKDILANLPPDIKITKEPEDPAALKILGDMKALLEQATARIDELTKQNQDLAKENETLNLSLLDNREARELDLQKTILENQTTVNIKAAELALQDKKIALDFQQKQQGLHLEAEKAVMDVIKDNNDAIYASTPEGSGKEAELARDELIEEAERRG